MQILKRLISVKNDRVMSALFAIGNLLNIKTETIKRRLSTKNSPSIMLHKQPYILFAGNCHFMFVDY